MEKNTEKYGFVPSGVSPEAFAEAVAFFRQQGVQASFCFGWKEEGESVSQARFKKYFDSAGVLGSPVLFDLRNKDRRAEMVKINEKIGKHRFFSFGDVLHHYGTGDYNFLLAHRDVNKDNALYSRLTSDDILEGNPGRVILVGYSPAIYKNFFKSNGVNKIVYTNGLRPGVRVTRDSIGMQSLPFGEVSPSIFVNLGSPQNDFYGVMELRDAGVSFHSPFNSVRSSGRLIDKVLG